MSEPNVREDRNIPNDQEPLRNEEPVSAPQPEKEPEHKEGEALSRKRRTALVAYMAVLFAVAFLLVALSMIMENKKLQSSNEKTSATLNGRIEELQNEYNNLKNTSEEQAARIAELESQAAEKEAAMETLEQQLDEAAAVREELEKEIRDGKDSLVEARQKAEDTFKVYDLLIRAKLADEEGDFEQLQELLDQIEPLKNLLSDDAKEIYESLIIA